MKKLEQLLIFKIGNCQYCIDSDLIIQILRVPEITKLPFAPKSIRGLCSIEGHIVPAIDMSTLICSLDGKFTNLENLKARVLSIKFKDMTLALVVDEVVQNIDIDDSDIEKNENSDEDISGVLKFADEIVQIINVEYLLSSVNLGNFVNRKLIPNKGPKIVLKEENIDYKKYLLFNMKDEVFGIEIDMIREIIVNTRNITPIANSNRDILGMITLRDEVLVIIDFRIEFDKFSPLSDKNRILIVKLEDAHIGILIDNIIDIKSISSSIIEKLPEKFRDKKVSGVVNLDDKLASIINNYYLKELGINGLNYIENNSDENDYIEEKAIDFMEVAIFSISGEEYAVDIDSVDEIIRYDNITKLPRVSEYLKGIINLRGEVVPILSLQKRLGFRECLNEDSKILISNIGGVRVGFLVDNVTEIKEINLKYIKKSEENNKLFSNVIILENGERMILKINTNNIFNFENINHLLEKVE